MHVSADVHLRDGFGRFIADIENAAPRAIADALDVGVGAARSAAPVKTGRLRGSFGTALLSRTSGVFYNTAPYAKFQDEGAGPHPIPARVSFFWEKVGRPWMTPETYRMVTGFEGADPIQHPGNPATHFYQRGYSAIKAAMPGILHKHYG